LGVQGDPAPRLALTLDHREWLGFLADEWWPALEATAGTRLGVDKPYGHPHIEGRIAVTAWIDPNRLPAIDVQAYRDGRWADAPVRTLSALDDEIVWPGPIPLFAVDSFSVHSHSDHARLVAMAKGFSNVEVPPQPINVVQVEMRPPMSGEPLPSSLLQRPPLWNAIRGAAAMAVWSVPAVGPWLDVLCESLSTSPTEPSTKPSSVALKAPWWNEPPWRPAASDVRGPPLWRAMLEVFAVSKAREEWRPRTILASVCERARHLGANPEPLDDLATQTRAILEDREAVDIRRAVHDPLGLILQLVLLRPTPDRFVSWKCDLPDLPPVVWWTGATLAGFLGGYRDLELRFRGPPAARRLLALRTWQLGGHTPSIAAEWPDAPAAALHWTVQGGRIQLQSAELAWADILPAEQTEDTHTDTPAARPTQ